MLGDEPVWHDGKVVGTLPIGASVETSYRYGHNDYGSESHTVELAYYQKLFWDRLTILFWYWRDTNCASFTSAFDPSEAFAVGRHGDLAHAASARERLQDVFHMRAID